MELNGKRIFYHGTNAKFDQIDLRVCPEKRDFGRGFYLTTQNAQAQKWAELKGRSAGVCWLYEYRLACDSGGEPLRSLALLEYDEKWLDIITWCRKTGSVPEKIREKWNLDCFGDYDVVYDRMADSRGNQLGVLIQRYYDGRLRAEKALEQIPFPERVRAYRDQYCFRSDKSVGLLRLRRRYQYRLTDASEWECEEEETL